MNKGQKVLRVKLVAHQQAAVVLQPGVAPLHFPATLQTTSCPAILSGRTLSIFPVRGNHFDSLIPQLRIEGITVVGFISDKSLQFFLYKALFENWLNKARFMDIGAVEINRNRNSTSIDDHFESTSRPFSTLADFFTPPLAGIKLPSMKHSDRLIFISEANALTAAKRIPSRLQVCR